MQYNPTCIDVGTQADEEGKKRDIIKQKSLSVHNMMSKKALEKKEKRPYQFLLRWDEAGGIDVHKDTFKVAACHQNEPPRQRTFGTFTKDIYGCVIFSLSKR